MNKASAKIVIIASLGIGLGYLFYRYAFPDDNDDGSDVLGDKYDENMPIIEYPDDIIVYTDAETNEVKVLQGEILTSTSTLDNEGFGTTVGEIIDNYNYAPGEDPMPICPDTVGAIGVCYPPGIINKNTVTVVEDVFAGVTLEGVLNPSPGEFVVYQDNFININIHNINDFQYWFEITDQNCSDGIPSGGIVYITPLTDLYPLDNDIALEEAELGISYFNGYQFPGPGVVEINIKIFCEDYYGEQTGTEDLTFQLAVGGYGN